jgi:hypothetical protein
MNFVENSSVNAKPPIESKRSYQVPMLSDYGDIRLITQTTGNTGGTMDTPATKTS